MSSSLPITASDRFAVYTAVLGQTELSVPFPFQSVADLKVIRTSNGVTVTLAYGDDYTVLGVNEPLGGTLTLTAECEGGESFVVLGDAVLAREGNTTQAGKFSSALIEKDLDRLTLIAQELARDIGRGVKVAFGGTGPEIATGAEGYIPVWDAHGNLVQGPSAAAIGAIEAALAVEAGRALVHGTGASDPYDAGARAVIARQLGINATPDATNVFSASLNTALWSALYDADGGDGSLRIKLNKEAAADVGSLLWQRGFSGRAELGLVGDDHLTLKVSPDGAAWTVAFTVDATTGVVTFQELLPVANIPELGAASLAAWALGKSTEDQVITGGAQVTPKDLGNLSGASITPDPGDRPIQKITNNGAGSILPGSNTGHYTLEVINTTGAGAITTTGWTLVGDPFDETTTSKFLCSCHVTANMKVMTIVKVA